MNRYIKLLFGIIVISLFIGLYYYNNNSKKRYNFIIIDIDHLRADALVCLGYRVEAAQNICQFAEKGAVFSSNYTHSYWTLPSVASTLTSLYPSAHGVNVAYKNKIPESAKTMFELFSDNGYKTLFVGPAEGEVIYMPKGYDRGVDVKEFLSIDGWEKAFESLEKKERPFLAFFYSGELHIPYNLNKGDELLHGVRRMEGFPDTEDKVEILMANYILNNYEDIFSEKALESDVFRSILRSGSAKDMLDYYLSFEHPSEEVKAPWHVEYASFMQFLDEEVKGNNEKTKYLRLLYDTKLSNIDKMFGNFILGLERRGLLENSVIVLMSDHGEEFMEHGGFAHYKSLYNEIIHTPLVIYIPGIESGEIAEITENIDIYPTLAEIAGVGKPRKIQGESLLKLIKGNKANTKSFAIAEKDNESASMIIDNWKIIVDYTAAETTYELYDLGKDGVEQDNLASKNLDLTLEMAKELEKIIKDSKKLYREEEGEFPEWIDEDTRERLIKRGYF